MQNKVTLSASAFSRGLARDGLCIERGQARG
jgi:hypothetical protein